jgi:hypothetical protein
MEFLRKFKQDADYQAFIWGGGFLKPNVSFIEEGENPLRYLSYSYNEYGISNPKINITGNCLNTIIGTVKIKTIDLYVY